MASWCGGWCLPSPLPGAVDLAFVSETERIAAAVAAVCKGRRVCVLESSKNPTMMAHGLVVEGARELALWKQQPHQLYCGSALSNHHVLMAIEPLELAWI